MKTKFFTLLLVFVMMFSLASISFASSATKTVEGPSNGDGGDVTILDVTYIDAGHTGKSAFDQSFTVSPNSGKNLNIWVQNNGSSSVEFLVERTDNGQDFGVRTVKAGSQLTRTFVMEDGGHMQGTYRVYVYTKDGSEMDIKVRARQY